MPALHQGQHLVRTSKARFKVVVCGRRWGKTLLGACLCLETALKGGYVWWVAPEYWRAKIAWRMMLKLIEPIPGAQIHRADAIITFASGGWIQLKSAVRPDMLRGEGLDLVVIDEVADVAEEAWEASLEPTLTDRRGSALFIGTPKGRTWFYGLYQRGLDRGRYPEWQSWRMPTSTNPFIARDELRRLEAQKPGRVWRQEYLAEFVTFEGRVYEMFSPECPAVFRGPLPDFVYREYIGGIDFGFTNPSALVVGGIDRDNRIDIVDEVYQRRMSSGDLIESCRQLTERWRVRMWWADPADPRMISELLAAGLPVEAAPRLAVMQTEDDALGSTDSLTAYRVRLVSARLEIEEPMLRFHEFCAETIREHDVYRYPPVKEGIPAREVPLKVDDHTCNAVQYLAHGYEQWCAIGDFEGAQVSEARESVHLPR